MCVCVCVCIYIYMYIKILRLTSKLTAPLWSVSNALNRKCAYVVESEMLKREYR